MFPVQARLSSRPCILTPLVILIHNKCKWIEVGIQHVPCGFRRLGPCRPINELGRLVPKPVMLVWKACAPSNPAATTDSMQLHGTVEHLHVSPNLEADFLRVGLRVVPAEVWYPPKTVVARNNLIHGELDPRDIVSFFNIRFVF